MTFTLWAAKWKLPPEAVVDYMQTFGMLPIEVQPSGQRAPGSESRQQSLVRLDAAKHGVWLSRNNVGVLLDARGVPVRYGLANESREQNKAVKSADLIGIRPIVVGPHHVGTVIGQFVSREVKKEGWQYQGDAHERAQRAWAEFVLAKGGDAAFCTGAGSFDNG